jgi:Fic family protein
LPIASERAIPARATTTRDLQDLVDKGALVRTGSLKSTRYHLNIDTH